MPSEACDSPALRTRRDEGIMDTAIDLSDASKALDLANIRFQLMYVPS